GAGGAHPRGAPRAAAHAGGGGDEGGRGPGENKERPPAENRPRQQQAPPATSSATEEKPPGCSRASLPRQAIAGTGWTRPITRGSGVCRVFADRRLGGTQNTVGKGWFAGR